MTDSRLRQQIMRDVSGFFCQPRASDQRRSSPKNAADRHPSGEPALAGFAGRLDRLFNQRWLMGLGNEAKSTVLPDLNPACDLYEEERGYLLTVHLPTVERELIQVTVGDGVLTLTAGRQHISEEKNDEKKYHRVQSQHSCFILTLTLPEDVICDDASSEFKGGFLIIHLPRHKPSRSPMINVEAH